MAVASATAAAAAAHAGEHSRCIARTPHIASSVSACISISHPVHVCLTRVAVTTPPPSQAPVFQPPHRSCNEMPASAESMCFPQPDHVCFPQSVQVTLRHIHDHYRFTTGGRINYSRPAFLIEKGNIIIIINSDQYSVTSAMEKKTCSEDPACRSKHL